MREELYIIQGGERYSVDLPKNNGITLKFQSNMFSDLSKFCASYSYTFRLPKTARNQMTFDILDDIRHDSTAYGKKMECEYWRDGILLVHDSYLYIQEVSDSYSAVMTWNVLKWLSKVNDDGLSLRDLDPSDADPTVIGWGTEMRQAGDMEGTMDNSKVSVYYRCGRLYQPTQYNPPLVPVRYLLNSIARHYGKESARDIFDFMREKPLEGKDFDEAEGMPFSIFEDGVVPLVSGEWSDRLIHRNTRRFSLLSTLRYDSNKSVPMCSYDSGNSIMCLPNYTYVKFDIGEGMESFFEFYKHTGYANCTQEELSPEKKDWEPHVQNSSDYIAFRPKRRYKGSLRGKLSFFYSVGLTGKLYLLKMHYLLNQEFSASVPRRYVPYTDEDGSIRDLIEIQYTRLENGVYDFVFDPQEGGDEVELTVESDYSGYDFWVLVTDMKGYITEGTLEFLPSHENSEIMDEVTQRSIEGARDYNEVDLFGNLPQISVMEFLKSLFYIENAYPVVRDDGRLGKMGYRDLYNNIREGKVYDWSSAVTGSSTEWEGTRRFTNGELGRRNLFTMCNYGNDGDKAAVFAPASSSFETENETLEQEKTIYAFPYSSANIRSANGILSGETFAYWVRKDKSFTYEVGSVNPIIGRVMKHSWWMDYDISNEHRTVIYKYLLFRIWQVSDINYADTVLARIMKKPKVVTRDLRLDMHTLSKLDFSKPVYIEQENAYFGIVSLKLGSNDVTKAELIMLPALTASELLEGRDSIPRMSVAGPSYLYKSSESNVRSDFEFDAYVNRSYIKHMELFLDGVKVGEADNVGLMQYNYNGVNGDHVLRCTATAANGKTCTVEHRFSVRFVGNDGVIPHIGISTDFSTAYLSYSSSVKNVKQITANIYNVDSYSEASLKIDGKVLKTVSSGNSFSADYDYNYRVEEALLGREKVSIEARMVLEDGSVYSELDEVKVALVKPDWYRDLTTYVGNIVMAMTSSAGYHTVKKDETVTIDNVFMSQDTFSLDAMCYFLETDVFDNPYYPLYVKFSVDCIDEDGNRVTEVLTDDITRIHNGFELRFEKSGYGRYNSLEIYCYAIIGSVSGNLRETSGRLVLNIYKANG